RTQIPPPTGVGDAPAGAAASSQKSRPPVTDITSETPSERCEPDGSFKTRVLFHSAAVRFNESKVEKPANQIYAELSLPGFVSKNAQPFGLSRPNFLTVHGFAQFVAEGSETLSFQRSSQRFSMVS